MVALNFWSHGHRMDFGCDSVITGWLSGGFHWYLMTLLVRVLSLNRASCFISCVHEMFENRLLCFCCYFIIQGVGLPSVGSLTLLQGARELLAGVEVHLPPGIHPCGTCTHGCSYKRGFEMENLKLKMFVSPQAVFIATKFRWWWILHWRTAILLKARRIARTQSTCSCSACFNRLACVYSSSLCQTVRTVGQEEFSSPGRM